MKTKTKTPKIESRLLSPLTIRRLGVVSTFLLRHKRAYDQNSVATPCLRELSTGKGHDCGSVACIFGLAVALFNKAKNRTELDAWEHGAKALGFKLTDADILLSGLETNTYFYSPAGAAAHRLFFGWPANFRNAGEYHSFSEVTAEMAAKRIAHFIATDGLE